MATPTPVISPAARSTYLGIFSIVRSALPRRPASLPASRRRPHIRPLHRSCRTLDNGSYRPSDFSNQGFTGYYDASAPTTGPLADSSNIGTPRITPKVLKDHLDAFVVGQDRAKRVLATAVYNHYQRIRELQRRDEEEEELLAQEERRRMSEIRRHPVEGREAELKRGIEVPSLTRDWLRDEDEFPGQQQTINMPPPGGSVSQGGRGQQAAPAEHGWRPQSRSSYTAAAPGPPGQQQQPQQQAQPLFDNTPLTIEKSNILLLGPSGVGKTLMAKTLARVLEVPFSISDCTPFTQAGYIGDDAEICVQRLLSAANYDVARAERGIIVLDEIDKIATAKVSHGKDVSGEGVQQALLKIIEGTTLQIQAKQERGASNNRQSGGAYGSPTNSPLSGGNMSGGSSGSGLAGGAGGKGEVYNVRTDNILFICAGAFNGLHKQILDRISKGSIGFGATVRAAPGSSSASTSGASENPHETILEGEDELFDKYLPYYTPPLPSPNGKPAKRQLNTLDLLEPSDLQKFGLIPELVGRLPLHCALSSLSIDALVQVLTEPRNSLLAQYRQLFALSSIDLRVTTPALHVIAKTASNMGTGARGLRTVMERLLGDSMFEAPGSGVRYVVVTEEVAERKAPAQCFGRKEGGRVREAVEADEEMWQARKRREEGGDEDVLEARARVNREGGAARTFEEYRVKAAASGFV